MAVYFFDTSGLVKCYVAEVGSAWVRGLIDPAAGNRIQVSRIAGVEVIAALGRRRRAGTVSAAGAARIIDDFRRDFANRYRVLEITPTILDRAMLLVETHPLRGFDAVQLAAGLVGDERRFRRGLPSLTFISADVDLNAAAVVEGLVVDDPNARP